MLRVKLKGLLLSTMIALVLMAHGLQPVPVLAWSDLGGAAVKSQNNSPYNRGLGLGVPWQPGSTTFYIKESEAKAGYQALAGSILSMTFIRSWGVSGDLTPTM